MTEGLDPTIILAEAIEKLADSIDRLAVGSRPAPVSQGGPPGPSTPASGPPPAANGGPPEGNDDTRIKKSKKVFAICAKRSWDIGDVGQRATGRDLGADSRKWSEADLNIVLNKLDEWEAQSQRATEPF